VSGEGAPQQALMDLPVGMTIGIVAAQWHARIQDSLVANAVAVCERLGVDYQLVRVPGAFEIPVVAQRLAADHDAVAAFGTVIRGDTPHFDYVCSAVTTGLAQIPLQTGVPVGFGILTCDTVAQAEARAGFPESAENKGAEVTEAALATAAVLKQL